jgi:hypothetical protein
MAKSFVNKNSNNIWPKTTGKVPPFGVLAFNCSIALFATLSPTVSGVSTIKNFVARLLSLLFTAKGEDFRFFCRG